MEFGGSSEDSNEVAEQEETPTPTPEEDEPTPTAEEDEELTPTKKVTTAPTRTPTAKPTATNTPAPTNAPSNTPTPSQVADNEPPVTNIYHPAEGGEITAKIDNKICIITSGPTDNVSSHTDIETRYAFDSAELGDWTKMQGYWCIESLSNGAHSVKYQSRDKAGNLESVKTRNFTVNISGN